MTISYVFEAPGKEIVDRIASVYVQPSLIVTFLRLKDTQEIKWVVWELTGNGTLIRIRETGFGYKFRELAVSKAGLEQSDFFICERRMDNKLRFARSILNKVPGPNYGKDKTYWFGKEVNVKGVSCKAFTFSECFAVISDQGKLEFYTTQPGPLKPITFSPTNQEVNIVTITQELAAFITPVRISNTGFLKLISWNIDKYYRVSQSLSNDSEYKVKRIACTSMESMEPRGKNRTVTGTIEKYDRLVVRYWDTKTLKQVANSGNLGGKAKLVDIESNFTDSVIPSYRSVSAAVTMNNKLKIVQWKESSLGKVEILDSWTGDKDILDAKITRCSGIYYVTPVIEKDNKFSLISWKVS